MATNLDGQLRYTLRQLCSPGMLARAEADPRLCEELERRGLAVSTLGGGWLPTDEGRRVDREGWTGS